MTTDQDDLDRVSRGGRITPDSLDLAMSLFARRVQETPIPERPTVDEALDAIRSGRRDRVVSAVLVGAALVIDVVLVVALAVWLR